MKDQLNIFFTIDENYTQHFTVTLTSILENNKDLSIRVFVIHDLKKISILNRASNFIKKRYGVTLELYSLNPKLFEEFKITDHVSKATYFRLLLTEIIPNDVNYGLFMDSDIIVTGPLRYFSQINFDNSCNSNSLFAVKDDDIVNVKRLNSLGFETMKYFNAGVMYINLKAWRNEKAPQHLIQIAEEFKQELLWWDQDVLNMFFYDKWSSLPFVYNAFALQEKMPNLPVVIHYTGSFKPWDYNNNHPYRYLYFKYLKITPYKFYNPFFYTYKKRIVGKIKKIFNVKNKQ